MLKDKFILFAQKFSKDEVLIKKLWSEILIYHINSKRIYHNLEHLIYILKEFEKIDLTQEEEIVIFFTTIYHDIIYDVTKNTNEAQSAIIAKKRLLDLKVPFSIIKQVVELILLTKTHNKTSIKAYQLFLDADLSVLGVESKIYKKYTLKIRKEYKIYSDDVYKIGRIKVLKHFLEKDKIFQSDFFYNKYEETAQKNIQNELLLLK